MNGMLGKCVCAAAFVLALKLRHIKERSNLRVRPRSINVCLNKGGFYLSCQWSARRARQLTLCGQLLIVLPLTHPESELYCCMSRSLQIEKCK